MAIVRAVALNHRTSLFTVSAAPCPEKPEKGDCHGPLAIMWDIQAGRGRPPAAETLLFQRPCASPNGSAGHRAKGLHILPSSWATAQSRNSSEVRLCRTEKPSREAF